MRLRSIVEGANECEEVGWLKCQIQWSDSVRLQIATSALGSVARKRVRICTYKGHGHDESGDAVEQ